MKVKLTTTHINNATGLQTEIGIYTTKPARPVLERR